MGKCPGCGTMNKDERFECYKCNARLTSKNVERSTASKVVFGTFLTNGLLIGVAGLIVFVLGVSDHRIRTDSGINIEPKQLIMWGAINLMIGVGCIATHFTIKKN